MTGTGGGLEGDGAGANGSTVAGAPDSVSTPLVLALDWPDVAGGAFQPGMSSCMPGRILAGSEMLLATARSPCRTPYRRAMAPSVSPDFTTCFTASGPAWLAAGVSGDSAALTEPARGRDALAVPTFDFAGMISFWPGRSAAFADSRLAAVSCATVMLFFRAIVQRLSPDFTT